MNNLKPTGLERFFEILPGTLTWLTLLSAPILSYYKPVWISLYIIIFDLYWFLKAANVATHLVHSYHLLTIHRKIHWLDWLKQLHNREQFEAHLKNLSETAPKRSMRKLYRSYHEKLAKLPPTHNLNWERLVHLIVFPTYKEDISVLEASIDSYAAVDYPKDKVILVVATEERAGAESLKQFEGLEAKYADKFLSVIVTLHPDGIAGEVRGKAGNMNHAVKESLKVLDAKGIKYEDVVVSTLDADTVIQPNYFSHLTYDFMMEEKPMQRSYQPMPVYNNNIWDTPAVARVIAVSSSFWQLVEASRPDRLITFSSHAMSLKTLLDVGLFRADSINEDSFIFWQCFMHFNGDYKTKPIFTTVSMDAVMGSSYFDTMVAQYKQKRRWAYGVGQMSFILPRFLRNKAIPLWKRLLYGERFIEGHYFWATGAVMVSVLGWLPLVLGGNNFGDSVLASNLPLLTRVIMTIATFFLIFSVYINMVLLPPRPAKYGRRKTVFMISQWLLAPIVSSVFGSFPAIDAQTRLLFGKYMEFWVTPKIRKAEPANKIINKELEKQSVR